MDIRKSGLYKYAEAPDFQILLLAYAHDDEPVQIVDILNNNAIPPQLVHDLFDPDVIKHAYNAPFEWYCLSRACGIPASESWLQQWRCPMATHDIIFAHEGDSNGMDFLTITLPGSRKLYYANPAMGINKWSRE